MTHAESAVSLNAHEVFERLEVKYPAPEWALFPQVADATGGAASNRADAVAMNLWPSRGLEVMGFEIKVYRGDWLRELKNPAKAEGGVFDYCDFWWIVAGDKGIVRDGELPPTWGLLEPHGRGLKTSVQAPKLDGQALDRFFAAALLRRAHEALKRSPNSAIKGARDAGYKAGRKDGDRSARLVVEQSQRLARQIQDFQEASGVSITAGFKSQREIGEAVRLVLDGGLNRFASRLEMVANHASRIQTDAQAVIDELNELPAVAPAPMGME